MATDITGKPNKKVSSLGAPARGSGRVMSASWKVPSAMTKSSSKKRATKLTVTWTVSTSSGARVLSNDYNTSVTSVSLNLDWFKVGNTTFTRNSFYPLTGSRLTSVSISVAGKNKKGNGKAAVATRAFSAPRAPEIDEISFNTSNGICSTTIRTDAGTDYLERYDTRYRITVITRTGETVIASDSSTTSEEYEVTYDASDYMNLTPDQFIKVTVEAWARGYAGDSAVVSRNFYVSHASKATITNQSVSSKDSTGKLTVEIDTNKTTEHPVDSVKLEYLYNTSYAKSSDIPANLPSGLQWEDSGLEDNGDCTAISMPIANLVPDRGKFTWIRVKTYHAHEAVLYRYSDYERVEALETPPAEQAESGITIISAMSGTDGESAVVLLGWNASGTDDSTGTEISWSDEENTWKSTKEPENFEFTWSDGVYPKTGTAEYNDSAEIVIKGLTEGKKYYIRARRYYEGDTTSYGRYSNTATVITNERPIGVVARCDKFVTAGEPLPIYWTFSGNGVQSAWQIVDSNGTNVANGEGTIGATRINADRLAELAVNNTLTFTVQVSTGSGFVSSEPKTVTILERPTLAITAPTTLTAQPFSFTATSDKPCDLAIIISAQGISGQLPSGYSNQTAGDTIYSDVVSPIWDNGTATVTMPTGLDFWDLGGYTMSVVAIDRDTKLQSDVVIKTFSISWAHQAVDPDEFITLTPLDYTVDEGEHVQAVQIGLTPPTGCAETDVYDIYRMDGDNAHLIGKGFPLTYTALDEFAPFGDSEDLYYRIALRTTDGDVEFADKEYELAGNTIRFDWQGGTLELPYGVSIGDSYSKSVEFRQHMDGSTDGYWNENIERKGSYSSSVIKLIQPEEINLARQLARYAGAVFVRTANGSAYTADVQVTDLSVKNKAVTAIAVDATEVGLTSEFMLPSPFEQEVE